MATGQDIIASGFQAVTEERRGRRRHSWILRRIALGVLTLFVVSLIVFAATQALPGDPAKAILGRDATPEKVAALKAELGLEGSLVKQYASWLGGLVQLDLGVSVGSGEPVSEVIGARAGNSILLAVLSGLIVVPLSLLIGVISAVRRDRAFDQVTIVTSLVLVALPEFVIGMLLVILFATTVMTLLPAVSVFAVGASPFAHLDAFVLPVATLVLVNVPYLSRLVRASMIDVLSSDYVEMARLKGLPERDVITRHALPNALVPTIQGTALVLAYIAGGIVVVEYVFRFPGIGTALTSAIAGRDMPVIQAITLVLAAIYVIVNLIADILTVYVSPRLRTAGA
jgi:peptide/nickel transport system permease protein